MFESQQTELQQMIETNAEFKRLYNEHQQLHKRVTAAENGTAPIADGSLNEMKREKLRLKDELSRMMASAHPN